MDSSIMLMKGRRELVRESSMLKDSGALVRGSGMLVGGRGM